MTTWLGPQLGAATVGVVLSLLLAGCSSAPTGANSAPPSTSPNPAARSTSPPASTATSTGAGAITWYDRAPYHLDQVFTSIETARPQLPGADDAFIEAVGTAAANYYAANRQCGIGPNAAPEVGIAVRAYDAAGYAWADEHGCGGAVQFWSKRFGGGWRAIITTQQPPTCEQDDQFEIPVAFTDGTCYDTTTSRERPYPGR